MWRLRGEVVPLGIVIRSLCLLLLYLRRWLAEYLKAELIEVVPCQCVLPKQSVVVQNAATERMPAKGRAFLAGLRWDVCDHSDGVWGLRTQSRAQLDRSKDYCLSPVGIPRCRTVQGLLPVPSGGYSTGRWKVGLLNRCVVLDTWLWALISQ